MSKRKGVSESEEAATKKFKAEASSDNASTTKLSFDSAQQCFLSLIYPTTMQNFFDNNWEKEPLCIQRKSSGYYGELWTKANLEAIAKKTKLVYDEDVFVYRYSKEDKEPIETKGRATVKSLQKYWKDEKATIMLSKPHRFCVCIYFYICLLLLIYLLICLPVCIFSFTSVRLYVHWFVPR